MKRRIGIIFGGKSTEHDVSLMSAVSVFNALPVDLYEPVKIGITRSGKWIKFDGTNDDVRSGKWEELGTSVNLTTLKDEIDFAFPILHGVNGEDGTIQGLFEMLDIPYAGCGVLASSVCMDKGIAKDIFVRNELPTCRYLLVHSQDILDDIDSVVEKVKDEFSGYVFVKPANMGSSIGISKARKADEIKDALRLASRHDTRILVEEAVNAREIEVGIIGNRNPEVSVPGEIIAATDYYDYGSKYDDDSSTILTIPAKIDDSVYEEIATIAKKAYRAVDCSGFSRIDFFLEKETGRVLINEINTIPGFTGGHSMFPLLWHNTGIAFPKLIEKIIDLGYERYYEKSGRYNYLTEI